MLPDHLCRRDVPGLDEAIPATEYAQLEGFSDDEIIAAIDARKLLGAQFHGVWYVEAPSFCEQRLSLLRSQRQQTDDHARGNRPSHRSSQISDEVTHAHVLGLGGRVTFADIKRHYRERMLEYHPDKVAALGPKLRELAEIETKKINAAYEFFTSKYGDNRNA